MPASIGRDEVGRLVAQNAVVVEVLARAGYEWAHLGRCDPPATERLGHHRGPPSPRPRPVSRGLLQRLPVRHEPEGGELGPLTQRMPRLGVDGVLVTRSDGNLLGLIKRHVAEQTLKEPDHAHR